MMTPRHARPASIPTISTNERVPASSRVSKNGSVEPYSVSSDTPNHLIWKARKDARQSEEDRTTNGRTQGGCPIRCGIDASVDQTSPNGKHRHVKRDSSNRLGRVLCRR